MIQVDRHSIGCQEGKWYTHLPQILCKWRKMNDRLKIIAIDYFIFFIKRYLCILRYSRSSHQDKRYNHFHQLLSKQHKMNGMLLRLNAKRIFTENFVRNFLHCARLGPTHPVPLAHTPGHAKRFC